MSKKIFLSGSITNNPNYIQDFREAQEYFGSQGMVAINPCEPEGMSYKDYIDIGLNKLMHWDIICMLPNWEESNGAKLELHYAETVGMEVWLFSPEKDLTLN